MYYEDDRLKLGYYKDRGSGCVTSVLLDMWEKSEEATNSAEKKDDGSVCVNMVMYIMGMDVRISGRVVSCEPGGTFVFDMYMGVNCVGQTYPTPFGPENKRSVDEGVCTKFEEFGNTYSFLGTCKEKIGNPDNDAEKAATEAKFAETCAAKFEQNVPLDDQQKYDHQLLFECLVGDISNEPAFGSFGSLAKSPEGVCHNIRLHNGPSQCVPLSFLVHSCRVGVGFRATWFVGLDCVPTSSMFEYEGPDGECVSPNNVPPLLVSCAPETLDMESKFEYELETFQDARCEERENDFEIFGEGTTLHASNPCHEVKRVEESKEGEPEVWVQPVKVVGCDSRRGIAVLQFYKKENCVDVNSGPKEFKQNECFDGVKISCHEKEVTVATPDDQPAMKLTSATPPVTSEFLAVAPPAGNTEDLEGDTSSLGAGHNINSPPTPNLISPQQAPPSIIFEINNSDNSDSDKAQTSSSDNSEDKNKDNSSKDESESAIDTDTLIIGIVGVLSGVVTLFSAGFGVYRHMQKKKTASNSVARIQSVTSEDLEEIRQRKSGIQYILK